VEAVVVPPAPVQARLKLEFAVRAGETSLPVVGLVPVQLPLAAHDVALVEDHVSVVELPVTTLVGAALSETVGATGGAEPPPPPPQAANTREIAAAAAKRANLGKRMQ
jgi:hypothetical protein